VLRHVHRSPTSLQHAENAFRLQSRSLAKHLVGGKAGHSDYSPFTIQHVQGFGTNISEGCDTTELQTGNQVGVMDEVEAVVVEMCNDWTGLVSGFGHSVEVDSAQWLSELYL